MFHLDKFIQMSPVFGVSLLFFALSMIRVFKAYKYIKEYAETRAQKHEGEEHVGILKIIIFFYIFFDALGVWFLRSYQMDYAQTLRDHFTQLWGVYDSVTIFGLMFMLFNMAAWRLITSVTNHGELSVDRGCDTKEES